MFANANGIPIELHTHCTTGLGPLCCLEAVKLGIKIVNTALPPLADGSSNPSLFNVAKNLRALGYKTADRRRDSQAGVATTSRTSPSAKVFPSASRSNTTMRNISIRCPAA